MTSHIEPATNRSNRLEVIRRLRRGGPITNNERRAAECIRRRLDLGDMVSDAQVEFMELVEKALGRKAR